MSPDKDGTYRLLPLPLHDRSTGAYVERKARRLLTPQVLGRSPQSVVLRWKTTGSKSVGAFCTCSTGCIGKLSPSPKSRSSYPPPPSYGSIKEDNDPTQRSRHMLSHVTHRIFSDMAENFGGQFDNSSLSAKSRAFLHQPEQARGFIIGRRRYQTGGNLRLEPTLEPAVRA